MTKNPTSDKGLEKDTDLNIHNSAAALVVSAARKSGLLREIAGILCYLDKNPGFAGTSRVAGAMRDELAEAFDDHVCLPPLVLESFYGVGSSDIGPRWDGEVEPYLGLQPDRDVAAK